MQIQASHQAIMFESQDFSGTEIHLKQHGVFEQQLHFASFSASCSQCWVARGMCAIKGISHTCFWLCQSPGLYHAALITVMAGTSQTQSERQVCDKAPSSLKHIQQTITYCSFLLQFRQAATSSVAALCDTGDQQVMLAFQYLTFQEQLNSH